MSLFNSKTADYSNVFLVFLYMLVPYCSGYVNWTYPGPENSGLTFNYKDIVYFTWTSSIDSPWMNLWCAPSHTKPQSSTYGKIHIYVALFSPDKEENISANHKINETVYHEQVPTNGTNPLSFDYSEYDYQGICHMQLEDLSGDDFANTPTFDLTSNDAVEPQTWGLFAPSSFSGATTSCAITSSSAATIPPWWAAATTPLPAAPTAPSSSSQSAQGVSSTYVQNSCEGIIADIRGLVREYYSHYHWSVLRCRRHSLDLDRCVLQKMLLYKTWEWRASVAESKCKTEEPG